jgi:hypothetical protein
MAMSQDAQQAKSLVPMSARWSWVWPLLTVLALLAIALALAGLARRYYDRRRPNTSNNLVASTLLQGAVIVIGGALIAALLGVIEEVRATRERARVKTRAIGRLRGAHVRDCQRAEAGRSQRQHPAA